MADSLNKVILIGNVGSNPEIISFNNGNKLASFSLATSHSWIDNKTKEKKTNTEWHKIVIYVEGLINIITKLQVSKGTKLYIEGKLTNKKWVDKNNQPRTTSEVILQGYDTKLIILNKNYSNNQENFNTSNIDTSVINNFDDFVISDTDNDFMF
jgi:single-strand DNA-binding protein